MDKTTKVLIVLMIAIVMSAADSSVVLLAFPDMTQLLHTNVSFSIWTILVYMLVIAVMTTQLGKVGDMFGRAKMFNIGLIIFTLGSALCGASPTILFLIGFRVFQGIGAALLFANSGAIVADTFPREKYGKAFGWISAGWGAGMLLGIVLGGALTTLFGWRYIFYINVPIGIIAAILGFAYIKDKAMIKRKIDIFGMLFLGIGLVLISFDAIRFAAYGFSVIDVILIAIGLVMICVLLWKERKTEDPLIDLSVFKNRILRFSLFASLFVSMSYFSVSFMMTLYLQGIIGLSPLDAALLLTPGAFIGVLLSPRMGGVSDRIGARIVATSGIIAFFIAISLYFAAISSGTTTLTTQLIIMFLAASTVSGFGVAMFYPSNNSAVMANSPQGAYGSMNGLLRTLQNIGGLTSYILVIYIAATAVPRSIAFQVFVGTTRLLGGLTSSFILGIQTALIGSIVLMIVAAVLSAARGKGAVRQHH